MHDAKEPRSSLGGYVGIGGITGATATHLVADQAEEVDALVVDPAEGRGGVAAVVGLEQGAGVDAHVEGHPQVLSTVFFAVVVSAGRGCEMRRRFPNDMVDEGNEEVFADEGASLENEPPQVLGRVD